MTRLRVCVITGSRAEYGLLYWVIRALKQDPYFELTLLATGSHLSAQFGLTVQDIERDGIAVDERVEMLVASDSPVAIAKSIGLGVMGIAGSLSRLKPDLVVLMGDRFEILAAAQACLVLRIPVAHLAGGDLTEGAIDDSMRHAITKLSHLHLVSNEDSAHRVIQLGEQPARVHVVGNPGLDAFLHEPLPARAELEATLGRPLAPRNFLVILHPETLPADAGVSPAELAAQMAQAIANALDSMPQDSAFWVFMPNADEGGRAIRMCWEQWAARRDGVCLVESLPRPMFLSLMAHGDLLLGNSSSALGEAPSLKLAAVDIGDRQASRMAAANVIRCPADSAAIEAAVQQALALDCAQVVNPYGDGMTGPRVAAILRALGDPRALLRKPFHHVGAMRKDAS